MSSQADSKQVARQLQEAGASKLPGHMGLELVELEEGLALMRCEITEVHMAPNGYLHAASIVALADTAAGYGTVASFPARATGFTTIELKANFVGTLLEGAMKAEARLTHGGRTTQVWDVDVTAEESGKSLGLFRCTQMILYPPE